jgi:hypothetical protein
MDLALSHSQQINASAIGMAINSPVTAALNFMMF